MRAARRGGGPPRSWSGRRAPLPRVCAVVGGTRLSRRLLPTPLRGPLGTERKWRHRAVSVRRVAQGLFWTRGPAESSASTPPPAHAATAVFPKQSEKGGGRVGPGLSLSPAKPRVRLALGGPKAVPRAQTQGTSPGAGPARPCAGGLEASVGGTQPGWGSMRPRRHGASGRFPACGGGPTLHSAELAAVIPVSLFPWAFRVLHRSLKLKRPAHSSLAKHVLARWRGQCPRCGVCWGRPP